MFAPSTLREDEDGLASWKPKADLGFVEMEYIGEEDETVIVAPSGRTYTFDKHEKRVVWVHPLDRNYIRYLKVAK